MDLPVDAIRWTLLPASEPPDVLTLTFNELPDAYRNVVADRHVYQLLVREALTAVRTLTQERNQLRRRVREQDETIRRLLTDRPTRPGTR